MYLTYFPSHIVKTVSCFFLLSVYQQTTAQTVFQPTLHTPKQLSVAVGWELYQYNKLGYQWKLNEENLLHPMATLVH